MKTALVLVPASLMIAGHAQAQDAPAEQQPAPSQPEASPEVQTSADVSDQEVSRFALAALVIQQIAGTEEAAQEEKEKAMVGTLQRTGLAPERFNEIARASQSDPELNERIQLAAAEHVKAAQQNEQ